MRFLTVAVTCLGLGLVALMPSAASAKSSHCAYKIGQGGNYRPLNNITARNMMCSTALKAIKHGSISTKTGNLKTKGFSCKVLKSSHLPTGNGMTEVIGGTVRCTAGKRSFTFTWAT